MRDGGEIIVFAGGHAEVDSGGRATVHEGSNTLVHEGGYVDTRDGGSVAYDYGEYTLAEGHKAHVYRESVHYLDESLVDESVRATWER